MAKYKTLKALRKAYASGKIPQRCKASVDNDCVTVYLPEADDEFGDNAVRVYNFEGSPEYLLIEALELLGIPAEHV